MALLCTDYFLPNYPTASANLIYIHSFLALQPSEKKARLDPKEAAKAKAQESRQANKAAKLAKEASGMRKLSSFFSARPAAK